jgi:hypothetical protein
MDRSKYVNHRIRVGWMKRKSAMGVLCEGTNSGRGRCKITLVEVVKNDMSIKEVTKSMMLDIIEWWRRTHVVNLD